MTNDELKAHLASLEQEFAAAQSQLLHLRQIYSDMREAARPVEDKMAECEKAMDAIRHHPRYKELEAQIPHLRKAVGA